ncbi:sugar phosphate isomerase/epimerase [Jeotgalibaca ciconiae]|uniref:Sugar phosphate isomerase/epimerase n=2 Tax=Jeotgalibaca ciconiae TaxID=2496265 RepID=A0A3S9H919_9LACT|nr:sugar phosphate isomerase/epimerase [Jeotgalibaca ciconiae]
MEGIFYMELNLAVRGHDFYREDTAERLAEKIAETGLKNIQFALPFSFPSVPSQFENMNPGMGNYYQRIFSKQDIQITVLSCYINMIHPDLNEREKLIDKFCSYLRVAKAFGASMVATETGCVDEEIHYTEENFTEEAFEKVVESVKKMVTYAEKLGMTVAIEGGLNHPIYSPKKMRELLDRIQSPNMQVILDVTNFLRPDTVQNQKEVIDEAFNLFGSEIAAIHLKDFVVENNLVKPVAIGTGEMDFEYLLKKVSQEKPYLHLIMEETKEPDIPNAIAYLEKINK